MTTHELLPLIVAVVGHRNLRPEDVPMLEARVEEVLRALQAEAGATPLMLLSALAEGADRLVARVALRINMPLLVPLPKERIAYEAEFTSDESRAEFRELIGRAERWFELDATEGVMLHGEDHHYRHLIAFLASHCQVLLALWDGVEKALPGGTADAVHFKLEGIPSRLDTHRTPLDPPDIGPVYHIVTPRMTNPAVNGVPGSCRCLLPGRVQGATGGETFARVIRHMNAFNTDIKITLEDALAQSAPTPLVPQALLKEYSAPVIAEERAFEEADTLARYFQRKTNMVVTSFMVLAFFALFSFEVYAYYYSEYPTILLLYVVPIAAAYGLFLVARHKDYQNKYLDYRALAEGLRVQWFWHVSGSEASVADHYLRKQRTELDWIRHAIRIWHLRLNPRVSTEKSPSTRTGFLHTLEHLVEDQAAYYARSEKRDAARAHHLSLWSNRLFLMGMIIAAAHVAWQLLFNESQPSYPILMSMSMVLIIAGLLVIYGDKRGFSAQAKQFSRMAEMYAAAGPRIREALAQDDVATVDALILELGRETLAENGDWVMMHRERPLEVPKLG